MIKRKLIYILLALLILASALTSALLLAMPDDGDDIDVVGFNRLAADIGEHWDDALNGHYAPDSAAEYSVISLNGRAVIGIEIGEGYIEFINRAAKEGYPLFDIVSGGEIVGKLAVIVDRNGAVNDTRRAIIASTTVFYVMLAVILAAYLAYLELIVFRPFKRMSDYAAFIANGELDIPLEMDRGNIFGAYTESFNTMRLQLKAAKLAESKARKDKEDFILEINHDMLSPLSVIKAAVQNIASKGTDGHAALIEEKVSELESILNDLMAANLQDNGEYKLYIDDASSDRLAEILKMCDYKRKIRSLEIEKCLVRCDELRTAQIFGNIIGNSYKYADTPIDVEGRVENGRLVLVIRDYGDTLDASELERLTERYYRGSNAVASNGAGLGLHIVETVQRRQGGDVYFRYDGGLAVILVFALA